VISHTHSALHKQWISKPTGGHAKYSTRCYLFLYPAETMQWSLPQPGHGETPQCPSRRGQQSLTAVISHPIMHDAALGPTAYAVGAWRARLSCFRARRTVATAPPRGLAGTSTRQHHTAAAGSIAALESIQRTPSPPGAALQHMRVDQMCCCAFDLLCAA
jgi:hypothetical protein